MNTEESSKKEQPEEKEEENVEEVPVADETPEEPPKEKAASATDAAVYDEQDLVGSINDMIKYIVQTLARQPDNIQLEQARGEDGTVVFSLTVDDEDKGRIIGREGRVIGAIRLLMRVAAVKAQIRVQLDVL